MRLSGQTLAFAHMGRTLQTPNLKCRLAREGV